MALQIAGGRGPKSAPTAGARRPIAVSSIDVSRRRRWIAAHIGFVGFLLLALLGFTSLQDETVVVESGGNTVLQLLYGVLCVFMVFGSGTALTRGRLVSVPLTILLLLGYCLLSVSWAVDPGASLRRLIQTAIVFWVIFRCVGDLGYARTLLLVRYMLILLLVLNYLTVALTGYGIHGDISEDGSSLFGNWRGILPHKNVAGAACAVTVIVMLFDVRGALRYLSPLVIVAALIFLSYTESKTSQSVLIVALVCGLSARLYSTTYRSIVGVALVIAGGIALLLASAYSDAARAYLNDPQALTGRGTIWPLLLEYARQHLWTGAGFASFWQIGDISPIWTLTDGWVAHYASHGHNGYLDLLVTIGLPGLLLALVTLILWPFAQLMFSVSIGRRQRALLLALFVFGVAHNLTESTLLNGAATVEIVFVMTIALISYLSKASPGEHQTLQSGIVAALLRRSPDPGLRGVARQVRYRSPGERGLSHASSSVGERTLLR